MSIADSNNDNGLPNRTNGTFAWIIVDGLLEGVEGPVHDWTALSEIQFQPKLALVSINWFKIRDAKVKRPFYILFSLERKESVLFIHFN